MTTRKYTSRSQQTTLTGSVTSGALTLPVVSATTLLGGATVSTGQTMTIVIDPDTSLEEVVDIYSATTNPVAGNNLTVVRGQDGSSPQDHSAGAVVRHMIIGRDLREANTHIESATGGIHGLASTSYVVGTIDAQTISNKTLGSALAAGGFKITGAADPSSAQDVATKNYVDTGMASQVAAAATSATSAAASATAASTSASSASTSASSALTSQTAAATSAASASASATAAATSANNAAVSATAAATSATSAATQATAAATSAASAAGAATAAATSATSSASSFTSMDQKYLGAKSADPTLNNQSGALATGATYFNTATNTMRVYNGSTWSNMTSTANITMFKYTASGGETSKSGADDNSATLGYTVGIEQVYLNGALLVRGADYVATTGTSITGLAALAAGDILTVLAFTPFSVATAVPLTTFTAKGDLAVGSGSSTVGTLGVGSDGSTLVANSANASGLGWATQQIAGKNCLINGGFDIWQRGTSSAGNAYLADRWYSALISGTGTFAQEATTVPTGVSYAMKFTASATAQPALYQAIETLNSLQFAGQNVTVSAQVAASTSTPMTMDIQYSTSVDNSVTGTWTSITATSGGTATPTSTTYVPISGVYAIPSTAKSLRVRIFTTSTIANTVVVYFGKAQTELGTIATFFTRNASTLQGELAACERYGIELNPNGNAYASLGSGYATSGTAFYPTIPLPVPLRTTPTSVTASAAGNWRVFNNLAVPTVTGFAINAGGCGSNTVSLAVTVSTGLTSGSFYALEANNNTAARLFISAEL